MVVTESPEMLASAGVRVLLTGSGSYVAGSRLTPIPAVRASVTDLGRCLVERAGLDPDHLVELIDPASPQKLSAALEEAAQQSEEVLLFYYVGHGLVNSRNELHLATHVTTDLTREEPVYQALPYSTVRDIIGRCRAKLIVIMLDCCFSGRAQGGAASARNDPFDAVQQQGVYVLASAGRDEAAWAPPGRYTAFTGALIRLLTEGDPAAPRRLTLDDVYRCLARTLPEQGLPRPRRQAADQIDVQPLVSNPAYQPLPPLSAPLGREDLGFSPYRGLAAFGPEDARFFFGREELSRTLLDLLAEHLSAGGPLLVTGPSGSGKSSLLRAGLIPSLQRMQQPAPGRSRPPYVLLKPGADPVSNLVRRVAEVSEAPREAVQAQVEADPVSFADVLREATRAHADERSIAPQRLVIVVDQFEETFTACTDEIQRQVFIEALCAACCQQENGPPPPALVVLCVRADFYGHCMAYPRLVTALEQPLVVGPMTTDQLRAVIAKPAKVAGLVLEDGLVDLLLQDLGTSSRSPATGPGGALPLLSHALLATWQHRQGSTLTLAGYHKSGGIAQSLARTADTTLDRLDLASQQIARRLLLRLVHLGDGTDDTRRQTPITELLPALDAPERGPAQHVLDQFVRARLLTADADTLEITHEALIRAWPKLQNWIETDRASLLARQQLTQDATAWKRSNQDPAFLYPDSRLATAQAAADEQHRIELSALEKVFLAASSRRARRRMRHARQIIAGLTTLLLLVAASSAVAFQQRADAQHERNLALSRLVATRADRVRDSDVSLAMQLGLAAYRISPTAEARSSLLDSTATYAESRMLGPLGVEMPSVAFSPDGRILAAGSADKTVRLWNVSNPRQPASLGLPLTGPAGVVTSVAFSPDGRILAAGSADKTVRLWNVSNPRQPASLGLPLTGPTAILNSIAFSPSGQILAAGSSDAKVYMWNMIDPNQPASLGSLLTADAGNVNSIAFSPSGQILAAGSSDAKVYLWNLTNPYLPGAVGEPLIGPAKQVNSVAFSPNGRILAVGSSDNKVWLWNVANVLRPISENPPLSGPASWIYSVAFSPDGGTVAAASADNTVFVWNLATESVTATLPHPSPVTSVSYGRDGHTLATSAADGVVRLWALPGPILTAAHNSVFTVAFSPDGHTLATASGDNAVRMWDITDPRAPTLLGSPLTASGILDGTVAYGLGGRLAAGEKDGTVQLWNVSDRTHPIKLPSLSGGLNGIVQSVAFEPGGRLMAASTSEGDIQLWDVADFLRPEPLVTLRTTTTTPDHDVFQVAFRPDGHILAAGSADGTVRLWDVTNPRHPVQLGSPQGGPTSAVYHVAFRPDGHILAAGSADGTVRLWDVTNPRQTLSLGSPLTGPKGYVYAVSFRPDGHTLATANSDKSVSLWDITNPRQPHTLGTLTGPSGTVFSVAFGPDGNVLAAGSQDNTARLWIINPDTATDYVCSTAGDPITRSEWARYVPGMPYTPPCTARS